MARPDMQWRSWPFLVGERLTLADVALVAYTHIAHEGGFDLSLYPAAWAGIGRVEADLGIE
ncbi:hypothetical protein [Caulobacter vibrioides]|uniref:hypothetical protein n=1 Tax=Caulobacter vibrioides TaxID=155892 RepID=UPI00300FCA0C